MQHGHRGGGGSLASGRVSCRGFNNASRALLDVLAISEHNPLRLLCNRGPSGTAGTVRGGRNGKVTFLLLLLGLLLLRVLTPGIICGRLFDLFDGCRSGRASLALALALWMLPASLPLLLTMAFSLLLPTLLDAA